MASCLVFNTRNNYKIITESYTDVGLLITDEPVFILKKPVSNQVLWLAIYDCLKSSRLKIKQPKRDEWGTWQKNMLKLLQETSFDKLYKTSSSCQVKLENDELFLFQYKYKPKIGLLANQIANHTFVFNENHYDEYINSLNNLLSITIE